METRILLRDYSHWKRCRRPVFKASLHSEAAAMGDCAPRCLEKEEDEWLMITRALNNRRERKWVDEVNLVRTKLGEYHQLKELEGEEEYQINFRLSPAQFSEIFNYWTSYQETDHCFEVNDKELYCLKCIHNYQSKLHLLDTSYTISSHGDGSVS